MEHSAFIEIDGRWINIAHITHVGRYRPRMLAPSRSYIALTSGTTLNVNLEVAEILALVQQAHVTCG